MPTPPRPDRIVRPATPGDAAAIVAIYDHYVAHSIITFEEQPVPVDEMVRRLAEVAAASLPWLVAEESGRVVGYAYASRWKTRSAYRHSVETTVYLAPDAVGHGIGSALYARLFPLLGARGVHAAVAGIALPNDASVALHERCGMRKVAHFPEVGFKFGRWIDVGYWQRTFGDDGGTRT